MTSPSAGASGPTEARLEESEEVVPAAREDLVRSGARGAMWLAVAQVVSKGVLAITTIVLARLLAPHDFGLVSLSLVLITYADAIGDAGVGQAMIYLPRTRTSVRAGLVCSLTMGLVLVVVGNLCAPAIARFFHEPGVAPLTRLLTVGLLASALSSLPEALLRRDLLFRQITLASIARILVTAGVSIGLAFAGYGAWSLAWGTVAGYVTYLVGTWLLTPDRPDVYIWRTTRQELRTVVGYGIPVASSSLLTRLIFDVDYLIIGRVLAATALGYYVLAFRLPEMLVINVFFILTAVTFPIYNKVRDDRQRLTTGYLASLRIFSLYGMAVGVGLAAAAPLVIPAFFGARWEPAVAPLVGLGLYAAFRAVGGGASEVYKAMGRPGLAVWVSGLRLVVLVPTLWFAAVRWGIVGVAWMQVGTSILFAVLLQAVVVRVMRVRWRDIGTTLLPAALVGVVVAAVAVPLVQWLPFSPLASLVIVGLVASAAVLGSLRLVFPRVLAELLGAFGSRRLGRG